MTTDKTISQDAARKLLEACKAICDFWDEGKTYGDPAQLHADAFIGGHDGAEPVTISDVLKLAIAAAEGSQTPSPAKENKLRHIPYVSKYFDPD